MIICIIFISYILGRRETFILSIHFFLYCNAKEITVRSFLQDIIGFFQIKPAIYYSFSLDLEALHNSEHNVSNIYNKMMETA